MTQTQLSTTELKGDVTHLSKKLQLFVGAMRLMERLAPQIVTHLMLQKFLNPRRKGDCDYSGRLPAGAHRLTVNHRDLALTGWSWDGDGPAVLVVHGWESHTGRMLPLIKPLLAQGYRVFTLDAPGHGLSPSAETDLYDASLAIEAMIAQHGPFDGVIAHSFGAAATAIALARAPQLMPAKVALLSPMRDISQHIEIFANIARLTPEARARLEQQIGRRLNRPLAEISAVAAAGRLPHAGLVIHDQDDLLIPHKVGCAVAGSWTGATFISTNRLGHRRGLGNREVIQTLVHFLEGEEVFGAALPISKGVQAAPEKAPRPYTWQNRQTAGAAG